MTEPSPFQVTTADHVGFSVASLQDAVAFWTEALGATFVRTGEMGGTFLKEVTGAQDSRVRAAVVEIASFRIELLQYEPGRPRRLSPPAPFEQGAAHLALIVSDLDQAILRCRRHGWRAQGTPQAIPEGAKAGTRVMYVVGPDGETIEFMQPPKGA